MKNEFCIIFKELRLEKRLTQEEIAKKLNISIQSIHKWEQNKCLPDTFNIIKICEFYNISSDYLLGLNNNKDDYHKIIRRFLELLESIQD
ncbi:TPA: helix-turn-helix transcriptional regulator [Staphylococcus aureus]|uniref:helix-turn-helix domain-containing protein n=1 Tax=Staphylococcus TaxID=1279 RepID=UPI0019D30012|nr:helix-turn-helix transcriptional regulator [Staphylococcus caprae]MBN6827178.1 helix-turn-helix transcriptional regulator [Staphylococcus caprae]HCW7257090.1 helix-turn-helix transcriptional regulator [Staphylococcus aureus]